MRRSTDRILTTYAGGLERPPELAVLLRGEPVDGRQLNRRVADAVAEIAERPESHTPVVGCEDVIAGTGPRLGHPKVCWAKFEAMAEGTRIASQRASER